MNPHCSTVIHACLISRLHDAYRENKKNLRRNLVCRETEQLHQSSAHSNVDQTEKHTTRRFFVCLLPGLSCPPLKTTCCSRSSARPVHTGMSSTHTQKHTNAHTPLFIPECVCVCVLQPANMHRQVQKLKITPAGSNPFKRSNALKITVYGSRRAAKKKSHVSACVCGRKRWRYGHFKMF